MAFGALGLFGSMVLVLLGILTLPQNELVVLLGAALAIDPSTPTALYAGTSEGTVGLRAGRPPGRQAELGCPGGRRWAMGSRNEPRPSGKSAPFFFTAKEGK